MKYLLTCMAGVEKIAKKEIVKQGGIITEVKDRLIFFKGNVKLMAKINLWSRVGNRVYLVLNEKENICDFDGLYNAVFQIDWKKYINRYYPVIIKATSIKSELSSTPAIQKITKKAIVDKMTNKSGNIMPEELNKPIFEVFSFFIENKIYILLNTSGETLYKRGYKKEAGDATIKETLASALVLYSNWRFKENLYDITCGAGTIAIEAAMIAKNIAPGLERKFSFENWNLLKEEDFDDIKENTQNKIFKNNYNIIASDIDKEILKQAQKNAKRAGVSGSITFIKKDLKNYIGENLEGTLVSNPPYGLRLKSFDIKNIHSNISSILRKNDNLKGGIITSFEDFDKMINLKNFKKRKLYNGNEKCYFYVKK